MDETQRRVARVLRLRDGNERWGYGRRRRGRGHGVDGGGGVRYVVWERWEVQFGFGLWA
jgi:hypothetical protein